MKIQLQLLKKFFSLLKNSELLIEYFPSFRFKLLLNGINYLRERNFDKNDKPNTQIYSCKRSLVSATSKNNVNEQKQRVLTKKNI